MKRSAFLALICAFATAQPTTAETNVQSAAAVAAQRGKVISQMFRLRYAYQAFQAGKYDLSKAHLRHLMRTASNEQQLLQFKGLHGDVVKASPWSYGLSFSFLPSGNIDKISSNEKFHTSIGTFNIQGGGQEKTGIGFQLGANVAYDSVLSSGGTLTYGASVTRKQYPAKRLNSTTVGASLKWSEYALGGRTQFMPYVKRTLPDEGTGHSTRYGFNVSHEYYLGDDASLTGSFGIERQNYDTADYLDGNLANAGVTYRGKLGAKMGLTLNATLTRATPRNAHLQYTGGVLSAEVTRWVPSWGRFGMHFNVSARDYVGNFPALGVPRKDRGASIGASYSPANFEIWGTVPKLSCTKSQNRSNVALYEYGSTDCAVSFEKRF